jgi:hypothetical protein
MCIELKIKSKHLALEPSIIRCEERKLKKRMKHNRDGETSYWELARQRDNLILHRRWNVRNESRATELARAYLAGKPYSHVEKKRKDETMFQMMIVPRIVAMVTKYGNKEQRTVDRKKIQEWSKQENA